MLHVPETHVPRARFPLIDVHTHLSWGDPAGETCKLLMPVEEILAVMDRKNIRMMVNLTGGYGKSLEECVRLLHKAHPSRFLVFTQPWSARLEWQRDDDFGIYEYACHEGNVQIRNFITASRAERAQASAAGGGQ